MSAQHSAPAGPVEHRPERTFDIEAAAMERQADGKLSSSFGGNGRDDLAPPPLPSHPAPTAPAPHQAALNTRTNNEMYVSSGSTGTAGSGGGGGDPAASSTQQLGIRRRKERLVLACNAYTVFFLWLLKFFLPAGTLAAAAAGQSGTPTGSGRHQQSADDARRPPAADPQSAAGCCSCPPSRRKCVSDWLATPFRRMTFVEGSDLIVETTGPGPLSSPRSILHFAHELLLGPPALALLSLALQVSIPICVLRQWFLDDGHSVGTMLSTFYTVAAAGDTPTAGDDTTTTAKGPWAPTVVVPHTRVLLVFLKVVVSLYVFYYIMLQDYKCICYMMLPVFRLFGVKRVQLVGRVTVFVVIIFLCFVYAASALIVFFVSLVLIAKSPNAEQTLLSGVGALFILEADDMLVYVTENDFEVARTLFEKYWRDSAKERQWEDFKRAEQAFDRKWRARAKEWAPEEFERAEALFQQKWAELAREQRLDRFRLCMYMVTVLFFPLVCIGLLLDFCIAIGRYS
ncbi:hypothetical protein PLESTM_001322600 [Pleodorina starrii]|nr:hypothetical protein PLESTM_001322600 [Pleodorina starrii]